MLITLNYQIFLQKAVQASKEDECFPVVFKKCSHLLQHEALFHLEKRDDDEDDDKCTVNVTLWYFRHFVSSYLTCRTLQSEVGMHVFFRSTNFALFRLSFPWLINVYRRTVKDIK